MFVVVAGCFALLAVGAVAGAALAIALGGPMEVGDDGGVEALAATLPCWRDHSGPDGGGDVVGLPCGLPGTLSGPPTGVLTGEDALTPSQETKFRRLVADLEEECEWPSCDY